jgi:hypothetical protein
VSLNVNLCRLERAATCTRALGDRPSNFNVLRWATNYCRHDVHFLHLFASRSDADMRSGYLECSVCIISQSIAGGVVAAGRIRSMKLTTSGPVHSHRKATFLTLGKSGDRE